MQKLDRAMPAVMKELHRLEFDYADGEGIDFEPYEEFLSEEETQSWIRVWTGNPSLEGKEYLVFGQDGTGGYAAFWCARADAAILDQPIVFFGSEGELGVLASNFADYLWILAGGFGPFEILAFPETIRTANSEFNAFAAKHAAASKKSPFEAFSNARAEFPKFDENVRALCR